MKIRINPSVACGAVKAPPSKSIAHRALICGALSGGSVINNLAPSKDIIATIDCLSAIGVDLTVNGNSFEIGGLDPFNVKENAVLNCHESGSTLRFLIPLCLVSGKKITFKGAKRLFERPLSIYESICQEQGILFEKGETELTVCGKLKSGNYRIRGDVSSQFISGMLFTLPLLDGVSIIEVIGELESKPYIDLTLQTLAEFGIKITHVGSRFIILGNQRYVSNELTVEGDCSNAANLYAFNLIGGNVTVEGINENSLQGDKVFYDIFKALETGKREFDLSNCPDLAPILFAVAAVKGGATFTGTARLKIKESDRSEAMAQELKKFGVDVEIGDNLVKIGSSTIKAPTETLCGHNDHRIVMALSVLCTVVGGVIEGAEAVEKSYPEFFNALRHLNIGFEFYEDGQL